MAEEHKDSFAETVDTAASAAHTVKGAIKAGKAISGAAKGAAAGGPYGAVAGAVWAGRKHIGKIIAVIITLLLLPVLFVLMLPGLIFGGLINAFSPADTEQPILNSETAIVESANDITFTINSILGEALDDVMTRIEADFASSGADQMEVKNPYSSGPVYNANLIISQYPFTSFEMCDDNGILLGVNKYNSSLIIVDIFNSAIYKNANMAILGTSGAGKTFTLQLMGLRMRRKNIPVFIIAPLKGHEFHRACANVGGEFIQISPASPHCINVMEIRKVDRSVNELLDGPGIQLSELAAKIQQLHIFFSLLIPDMSHEERQLLDEALIRTYNAKGITHDNASLEDPANPGHYREMPVLGDLYEILKAAPETIRMAHILNRLVNGSASTFNKATNVRLDNKYTVLDISSLTGDLLTVGMFVVLDFVWDRAKADRTEEKAILIDECWQLLSGAGATGTRLAGDFVLEIFKTIRGYGGSAVCASQDLNDFFNLDEGRFGKGIINNSKTKIILNLEDDEAERVQETLHLSDAETMEVTHFERGNGLISTNNNNIMVEFKASPLEKDLITTDRRELREILERKRREQEPA